MAITIIVLISISIGFLGGAALASLRKAPEMPTIEPSTPTISALPLAQPTRRQLRLMRARKRELNDSLTDRWN